MSAIVERAIADALDAHGAACVHREAAKATLGREREASTTDRSASGIWSF